MKKKLILWILVLVYALAGLVSCEAAASYNNSKNISTNKYEQSTGVVYGKVVYVKDGDTIVFQLKGGMNYNVRLYGIDTPEKAQAYGPQATGILRNLIGNKIVAMKVYSTDRYGRTLGKIYLDRQDMNAEMIRLGAAWHYKYYDKSEDFDRYAELERLARRERRGLWNRPNPTPPWEYRKAVRTKNKR